MYAQEVGKGWAARVIIDDVGPRLVGSMFTTGPYLCVAVWPPCTVKAW